MDEKRGTGESDAVEAGLRELVRRDPDLATVLRRRGPPPPRFSRAPGFASLVRIILEQQVSLASAAAVFHRLEREVAALTPAGLLGLGGERLRAAGVSRQKARYMVGLAERLVGGDLCLEHVAGLPDDDARAALTAVPGIGRWSADIYLMMALDRADVWPSGDLALIRAVVRVKGLGEGAGRREVDDAARAWRPWRSSAARLLWHDYLSGTAEG